MFRTVICFAYVLISMIYLIPFGIIVVLGNLFFLKKPMSVFMNWIGIQWSWIMIKLVGCKVTVSGRENIPKKGGVCFVSNHDSIADIVMFLRYAGRQAGFIAKKELLFIPLVNLWIYVVGGKFINRKNPRKALKTINEGIAYIKSGGAMIVFPEGSRSRGRGLMPFHPGSIKLATQSQAAIVPVALKGTYELFEKTGRVQPGPVKVVFCKPIPTIEIKTRDSRQELCGIVYEAIKEALE